jgi:hypothetical protein
MFIITALLCLNVIESKGQEFFKLFENEYISIQVSIISYPSKLNEGHYANDISINVINNIIRSNSDYYDVYIDYIKIYRKDNAIPLATWTGGWLEHKSRLSQKVTTESKKPLTQNDITRAVSVGKGPYKRVYGVNRGSWY